MQKNTKPKNEALNQESDHSAKTVGSPTVADAHQSRHARGADLSVMAGSRQSSPTAANVATGPRTAAGKRRSKYNALKHGIFSQEVVLEGESRPRYDSVLTGLLVYFQPVGLPEELLVEKLATLLWRQRRLVVAEGAEIRRGAKFIEWDKMIEMQHEVEQIEEAMQAGRRRPSRIPTRPGLVHRIDNPTIRARCLELLGQLRLAIDKTGFDENLDLFVLEKIYGDRGRRTVRTTLRDSYYGWLAMSRMSEGEQKREGSSLPSQCKENILREIDLEIRRLEEFTRSQTSIEASRTQLDRLRLNVPDSPALDRLLRYEASLDRSFGRTLSQLERLQQMRRGQPVPPTVKVEINE